MAVAIAGLWELGWTTPIMEADIWRFLLRDFAVDAWIMSPISGIAAGDVREFPDIESVLDELRGYYVPVFVDEEADDELATFEHPENALYIFGKANGSPFRESRTAIDRAVKIRTPAGAGLLWPHHAAAIVLYHRSSHWP